MALGASDRLIGLCQQQVSVGQPGEAVVEGQLANLQARALAPQGQGAQVRAHLHQAQVEVVRAAILAVVESECTDYLVVAGFNRG
ncbi:hypothetical protein D3C76_751490 [compost metagenome]